MNENVEVTESIGWRDGRAAASRSGHFVFSPFRSKIWLEAENAALRHQLIVLRRNVPIGSLMLSLCKPTMMRCNKIEGQNADW